MPPYNDLLSLPFNYLTCFELHTEIFTLQGSVPKKDGIPDLEFLGPDCFHFSQRTHALSEYIRNILETMNKSNKLCNYSQT